MMFAGSDLKGILTVIYTYLDSVVSIYWKFTENSKFLYSYAAIEEKARPRVQKLQPVQCIPIYCYYFYCMWAIHHINILFLVTKFQLTEMEIA